MLMIRPEASGDAVAMPHVHTLASDRPQEADLVNALRRHGGLTISLVALQDGRNAGHMRLWLHSRSRMKGAYPCHT
jgi:predicted N-acetyltransferase YhbS